MTASVFPAANKDGTDFFQTKTPDKPGPFRFLLRTLFAGIDQTVENALCRRSRQRQPRQQQSADFLFHLFQSLSAVG